MNGGIKLEIWIQYKGLLASRMHAVQLSGKESKSMNTAGLLRVFANHLRAFGLDQLAPEYNIVWGSGQIRAYWEFDYNSIECQELRTLLIKAGRISIKHCPIEHIASITIKETDKPVCFFRVQSHFIKPSASTSTEPLYAATQTTAVPNWPDPEPPYAPSQIPIDLCPSSQATILATQPYDSTSLAVPESAAVAPFNQSVTVAYAPIVDIPQGLAIIDVAPQPTEQTTPPLPTKRKREDESCEPSPAPQSKRPNLAVVAPPQATPLPQSPQAFPDIPKFVVPPSPITPSSHLFIPHNTTETQHQTPHESYVLPPKSFQEYRLDLRGVFKTLLMSTQKRLGKTRTQLGEVTEELLGERQERKRLEEDLGRLPGREQEEYGPVVLPLSPPRSPTSEDINARLDRLRICGDAPMADLPVEEELDEDPLLEKTGKRSPSETEISLLAQIQQLEASLLQERAARKAAEQEQDALQSLLDSERQQRAQAEKAMDSLRGIPPATVPAFVEALDKLAQLTDKVMLSKGL